MEVPRERGILLGWLLFYLWAFLLGALLFVPGMVWFSRLNAKPHLILALAPSFSIIVLTIAMTATELAGWRVPWYGYVLLLTVLSALGVWVNRSNMRHYFNRGAWSSSTVPLYIAVSLVLVTWIYVKNLDGPGSLIPLYDNAHTLSLINSFAKTDCYGPLLSSVYLDTPQLFQGLSYYPAVLHSIAALAANMFGCSAPEALNIVVFDILFLVLPLSTRSLIKSAFPGNREAELFGVFSPFVFYAFPWGLLIFGPLQTYLVGLSFVLAVLSAFISLADWHNASHMSYFGLSVAGLATVSLCHPSTLFSVGILAIPLIIKAAISAPPFKALSWKRKSLVVVATLATILGIWLISYNLPFLKGTVSYTWRAFMAPSQAFSAVLGLSLTDSPSQPIVAFLVVIGAFSCIRRREGSSWLIASTFLAALVYCIDVTADGWLKQLLGGFWYTDSRRIAAMLIIPMIPLFSAGVGCAYSNVKVYVENKKDTQASSTAMGTGIALLLVAFSFGPDVSLYGSINLPSAISYARASLSSLYSLSTFQHRDDWSETLMLDKGELDVGNDIASIASDGGLVLNNALDGSAFFYSACGVNVLNRTCGSGYGDDENAELAKYAAGYTSNSAIKKKMSDLDIRYVLQLDSGATPMEASTFALNYKVSDWAGIQDITPETPGFELVYSRGDIRLYRLTDI